MPRPRTEREAWEEEYAELPALIERWQAELDAMPLDQKERGEGLKWRIRRDRKRLAELEARLAGDTT